MSKLTPPPKPPAYRSSRTGVEELAATRDAELDVETLRQSEFSRERAAARQRTSAPQPADAATEQPPEAPAVAESATHLLWGRFEPRWVLGAAMGFVLSGLVTAAALWTAIGTTIATRPASTSAKSAIVSAAPPPSTPVSAATEQAEPAREDETRKLAAIPPAKRTAAETVALARLELADEVQKLQRLRERLHTDPTLGRERSTMKLLLAATRDDARALDALAVMAELPGPESADLLYEVWTGTAERTRTTAVAEQLVYSRDVLPKASPALRVALDLRRAKDCEAFEAIIPRATELGDRRSLSLLGRLNRPRIGCGPDGKEDCHGCVKHSKPLTKAIHATLRRPAPRYE